MEPNLIDIEAYLKGVKVAPHVDAPFTDNLKINFILKLFKLQPTVIEKEKMNPKCLERDILKYVVRLGLFNYTDLWYCWVKKKINEFHYRYKRTILIKQDDIKTYKLLCKLFLYIKFETNIFESQNPGQEFSYFVAAQYSKRVSCSGFLTSVNLNTFLYPENRENYLEFISSGYPAGMIEPKDEFLFLNKDVPDKKLIYETAKLSDSKNSLFLSVGVPIIKETLPCCKTKNEDWLNRYLYALEKLIVREKLLKRTYYKFLFSIEHLRVHSVLRKLHADN